MELWNHTGQAYIQFILLTSIPFPYSVLSNLHCFIPKTLYCQTSIPTLSNLHPYTVKLPFLFCQTSIPILSILHSHTVKPPFPYSQTPILDIQVELALGAFPYGKWTTIFEQLNAVVNGPAPNLPETDRYSPELREFAAAW